MSVSHSPPFLSDRQRSEGTRLKTQPWKRDTPATVVNNSLFFSFARPVLGSVTSPGTIGMSQHTNVDVTRLRRTPTFHPRPGSLRWPENYPELLTRQSERATVGFGSLRNGKSPRGRPGYEILFARSRRRSSLTALANETNHAGYGPRTTHSYSTTRAYRFRAQLHLALRFD
jgi:hypothetical protein